MRASLLLAVALACAACAPGSVSFVDKPVSSSDTDGSIDTDTDGSPTPTTCPGVFPSGQGPGCCTAANALTPDAGRAACNDAGEWVCAQGQLCTCQGVVADYECLDDCAWTVADPPGCIFSDHYECFVPTEIDARTCP